MDVKYAFKETRLSLEPSAPSSVANITLPASRWSTQRKPAASDSVAHDENAFKQRNLAIASSVYFRSGKHAPKSFLWRVLDDCYVLSIRVVDVHKEKTSPDAPLILNFHFNTQIHADCVALADSPEHDALHVFVLDQALQLYCFTLRPDYFRKRSNLQSNLSDTLKMYSPSELGSRYPHRLYAVNPDMLVVALGDGALVRFDRTRPGDASGRPWREQGLNSSGWGSGIRNLLSFSSKHTIKHGRHNLDYATTTSAQVTTLGADGQLFLVTVCLDHRMRIWNLGTGNLVHMGDVLGQERNNPQDQGKWAVDPTQTTLVRVVGQGKGTRLGVIYSPVGAGEFKFWTITMRDPDAVVVTDQFPRLLLVPKTPSSSDIWTLADFAVLHPDHGDVQIWTLWKNNITYRVQRLDAELAALGEYWNDAWDTVYAEASSPDPPDSGPFNATDVTEKWLQLITAPGRFTKATLDTALAMYERGLGAPKDAVARGRRSLAEAICSVISSTATLDRGSSGGMNYEEFRRTNEKQWRQFYRLLLELDKLRGEALSLAFDAEEGMTWVVCADVMSAIRTSTDVERLCFTVSDPAHGPPAALVSASFTFMKDFANSIRQLCYSLLRAEMFTEPDKTDYGRIQSFHERSGLWRAVSNDTCNDVARILGENFEGATSDAYRKLLTGLASSPESRASRAPSRPLTEFGRKLIVRAVHEATELQWNVCFGQLLLLLYMEFDPENEADALHNTVDVGLLYRQLIAALRRLELVRWLIKTEITVPSAHVDRGVGGTPSSAAKAGGEEPQTITALEGNLAHLIGFGDNMNWTDTLTSSISAVVRDLCAADGDIEIVPTLIQSFLVRKDRADLAGELAPFCDDEPFSVYIQGRVCLALNDLDTAASHFRKAATGMSSKSAQVERHTGGLLDETEKRLLHNGLTSYHCHIVALFEKARAYSYVMDFASLALQFLMVAPAAEEQNGVTTKTDILGRLFNAATMTSHFELAHTTLQSMANPTLQLKCLQKLVDRMCETNHSAEMMALPFGRLQPAVDGWLDEKCRASSSDDVLRGGSTPYHQILYAWRVRYSNYRGAATVLLDRIQKLREAGEADKLLGEDGFDTPVTKLYLLLINALSCVDPSEAWVFAEASDHAGGDKAMGGNANGNGRKKRKVVALADVRKEYQDELDRISAIQNNQFGLEAGDEMEVM